MNVDSGILQFAPKGSYYEGKDEQFMNVFKQWRDLFKFDRTLFALLSILEGTGFSKGMMAYILLDNPIDEGSGKDLVKYSLDPGFEKKVILYNLHKQKLPRALRNLLILAGDDPNVPPVNNSRTRKIILEFLFNRDNNDLDDMAVNFKNKMARLVRHALGKQDLYKITDLGDRKLFKKHIGRYNRFAYPVILHLFNKDFRGETTAYFPKIQQYQDLHLAAKAVDVDKFRELMVGMPILTAMGFRNTYNVGIPKEEVLEKTKMSTRQSIQMESAAKKAGAKIDIDYKKQDIYDLWKALYNKFLTEDEENVEEIAKAISEKDEARYDFGPTCVILDASASMGGSSERPLHPIITALCILSTLKNVKELHFSGGQEAVPGFIVPSGSTSLWPNLIEAAKAEPETIIVISDGYENSVQGAFDHVYQYLKKKGYKFNLLHLNPVYSAEAKRGSMRRLSADIKPLPVADRKYLETEIIFHQMVENREMVKGLLVDKYQKLIGGAK